MTVNVHDGRDGAGATSTTVDDTQDVTITVENVEEPGTVTLTTDTEHISARVEVTAELGDPDGSVTGLTWQWSHSPNGRTDWANISDATSDIHTPADVLQGRYLRATASYTDGHGADKIAHGVSPRRVEEPPPVNSAPAFPSTEDGRREVAEDASSGDTIGDPVAAIDLNAGDSAVNDPLVYSLTGTDADSFTIDPGTGQLALAQDVELDFEGKRSYRVTVQVTDGRDQNGDDDDDVIDDTINVSINVTNVNEAPTVSGEATASYTENGSKAIATYTGRDPERDKLTWSTSGTDGNDFVMTTQGRLHFASPPSFEDRDSYNVTVVATDEGALTGMFAVTVTVTDVEEEGAVTITPPRGWTGTEFSATLTDGDGSLADQTWQWARSTNRSSWTDITDETSVTYTATADDAGNYLRARTEYTDSRGGGKTAQTVLTVRIADAADRPATNNAPEFADTTATRSIGQGTALGRSIGAAVRARDADRDDVLIYSLSGTDAESFDIDPRTGQLRTKSVLDPAVKDTYTVTVSVHDGFDASYSPSTTSDATIDVTITVTSPPPPVVRQPTPPVVVVVDDEDEDDGGGGGTGGGGAGGGGGGGGGAAPANRSPEFREGSTTGRLIAENTPANVAIGAPVTATDPEGNTLTYALSGPDAALFTIDERTGRIRVGAGTMLDYEADQNVHGGDRHRRGRIRREGRRHRDHPRDQRGTAGQRQRLRRGPQRDDRPRRGHRGGGRLLPGGHHQGRDASHNQSLLHRLTRRAGEWRAASRRRESFDHESVGAVGGRWGDCWSRGAIAPLSRRRNVARGRQVLLRAVGASRRHTGGRRHRHRIRQLWSSHRNPSRRVRLHGLQPVRRGGVGRRPDRRLHPAWGHELHVYRRRPQRGGFLLLLGSPAERGQSRRTGWRRFLHQGRS